MVLLCVRINQNIRVLLYMGYVRRSKQSERQRRWCDLLLLFVCVRVCVGYLVFSLSVILDRGQSTPFEIIMIQLILVCGSLISQRVCPSHTPVTNSFFETHSTHSTQAQEDEEGQHSSSFF